MFDVDADRYVSLCHPATRGAIRFLISGRFVARLVLLALIVTPWNAFAQNTQVAGYVRDAQSQGIRGAEVTLLNRATADRRAVRTNDSGLYVFGSVSSGTYDLVTTAAGFQEVTTSPLIVEVGQSLQVNVRLAIAGVDENVNVTADAVRIGSRDGSLGTTIDQAAIKTMPLSGGTFQALLELSPGVVNVATASGAYAVNGQRGDTLSLSVDGVSANVGVNANTILRESAAGQAPGTTITGGYNGLVALGALKEFRIQTSTFSPEFGRTPGAQVSIVSQSGSNSLTGGGFYRMRDDALDANDWFLNRSGVEAPVLKQNYYGGTLGGPIVRNRLFHFLSYERLHLKQPTVINATVPTRSARDRAVPLTRPFLNAFPEPTGPDLTANDAEFVAAVTDVRNGDAFSLRLDTATRLFPQLFVRYNEAPSHSQTDRITSGNRTARRLRTITFGSTFAPSSRWLIDTRFNYTRNRATQSADGLDIPSSWVPEPFDLQFVLLLPSSPMSFQKGKTTVSSQTQWNGVASLSAMFGAHSVKAGLDYRVLGPDVERPSKSFSFGFNTTADAIAGRLNNASINNIKGTGASFTSVGAYLQDTWRPTARLSLTYGVRWEMAPSPSFESGETPPIAVNFGNIAALDLAFRPGEPLWRTRYANLAPRIGGSYTLDADGRFVVRGGIGTFYDLGQQGASALLNGAAFPSVRTLSLVSYPLPLTSADAAGVALAAPIAPPYSFALFFVDPELRTPYTVQWNAALEYSISRNDTVEVAYVGARGHRLLQTSFYRAPNPRFTGTINTIGNEGQSEYNSLQLQYRRRLSHGVTARAAYTYSRSYDNNSDTQSARVPTDAHLTDEWGYSDFDVPHSASGSITWMPSVGGPAPLKAIIGDWTVGLLGRVRSGTPFTVVLGRDTFGLGMSTIERPDIVPGEPFWIGDPNVPGGQRLNRDAFSTPPARRQGNLPRNSIRGFSVAQFDLSLARSIPLGRERRIDLRIDTFNVFNTPNFVIGVTSPSLASATFGQATGMLNQARSSLQGDRLNPLYQLGGPRSVELSVSYRF
jgi:hypothetical protein